MTMNVPLDVPWDVGTAAPGTDQRVVFVVLGVADTRLPTHYYSPARARALAAELFVAADKADAQNGGG